MIEEQYRNEKQIRSRINYLAFNLCFIYVLNLENNLPKWTSQNIVIRDSTPSLLALTGSPNDKD